MYVAPLVLMDAVREGSGRDQPLRETLVRSIGWCGGSPGVEPLHVRGLERGGVRDSADPYLGPQWPRPPRPRALIERMAQLFLPPWDSFRLCFFACPGGVPPCPGGVHRDERSTTVQCLLYVCGT